MTKISEEEWKKAVSLARHLARREHQLEKLKSMGAPKTIIQDTERGVAVARKRLEENIIAVEILPQARIRFRMQELRWEWFENSPLGTLQSAVWSVVLEKTADDSEEVAAKRLFEDKEDQDYWVKFRKALRGGQESEACEALCYLISGANAGLLWEDPPPIPPPYFFDDETYSAHNDPEDVN